MILFTYILMAKKINFNCEDNMIKKVMCILMIICAIDMIAHQPFEQLSKNFSMSIVNTASDNEAYRRIYESIELHGGRDFDIHLNSYHGDTLQLNKLLFLRGCNEYMVEKLVQAGAAVNYPQSVGRFSGRSYQEYMRTPLHAQIVHNNFAVATKLVQLGACIDLQDSYGQTPIHSAIFAVTADDEGLDIEPMYNFLCAVQKDRLYVDVLYDIKNKRDQSFMDLLGQEEKSLQQVEDEWACKTSFFYNYNQQSLIKVRALQKKVKELPRFVIPESD